ncbi:uncharacterized protein LOC144116012 [Amblyomma americanum]
MPRRFTGKLFHFLFTHLELGTFGERLRWLDREQGIFQLLWKHGNGTSRTPAEDVALFMAWHQEKKRRKPCDGTEAKQRFRAATNKMRLEVVKSWRGITPEKNFQYRRFPKDDLEYLLRHADLDQDVPWYRTEPTSSDEAQGSEDMILSTMEPEEGLFSHTAASTRWSYEHSVSFELQGPPPLYAPMPASFEEREVKVPPELLQDSTPLAPDTTSFAPGRVVQIKVEKTSEADESTEAQDPTVFTPKLASPHKIHEGTASPGVRDSLENVPHCPQSTSRQQNQQQPTVSHSQQRRVSQCSSKSWKKVMHQRWLRPVRLTTPYQRSKCC